MTSQLAPLVKSWQGTTTITLQPGEYDDDEPVVIANKVLTITGPRDAVVHSEFTLYNSYLVFDGFTMEMNKIGAPQRTGIVWPAFPQNGMVTSLNSQFWSDDVLWRSWKPDDWLEEGGPTQFNKCAYHGEGGFARFMTRTKRSPIDWRGNDAQVLEQYYGGVLYLYGKDNDNITLGIQPGTSPEMGAAVSIVNARLIMSGSHIYDNGYSLIGVSGARDSYVQVGSGLDATIQKPIPVLLDESSRKWVAPGSFG